MSVALPIHTITFDRPLGFWARLWAHFRHPRTDFLDRCILVFAVFAPFTNIPQLLRVYVGHHADLSLVSWVLYALFNIPLFSHGLIRKDRLILFNTGLNMVMQMLVVAGIVLYR